MVALCTLKRMDDVCYICVHASPSKNLCFMSCWSVALLLYYSLLPKSIALMYPAIKACMTIRLAICVGCITNCTQDFCDKSKTSRVSLGLQYAPFRMCTTPLPRRNWCNLWFINELHGMLWWLGGYLCPTHVFLRPVGTDSNGEQIEVSTKHISTSIAIDQPQQNEHILLSRSNVDAVQHVLHPRYTLTVTKHPPSQMQASENGRPYNTAPCTPWEFQCASLTTKRFRKTAYHFFTSRQHKLSN